MFVSSMILNVCVVLSFYNSVINPFLSNLCPSWDDLNYSEVSLSSRFVCFDFFSSCVVEFNNDAFVDISHQSPLHFCRVRHFYWRVGCFMYVLIQIICKKCFCCLRIVDSSPAGNRPSGSFLEASVSQSSVWSVLSFQTAASRRRGGTAISSSFLEVSTVTE